MVMTTGDGKNGIGFTHMIGDIMETSREYNEIEQLYYEMHKLSSIPIRIPFFHGST